MFLFYILINFTPSLVYLSLFIQRKSEKAEKYRKKIVRKKLLTNEWATNCTNTIWNRYIWCLKSMKIKPCEYTSVQKTISVLNTNFSKIYKYVKVVKAANPKPK